MNRPTRRLSTCLALVLGAATLSVVASSADAAGPANDAQSVAADRLADDASGSLTQRSDGGVLDFVGVPAGESIDNPGVSSSSSVADAAAAHLSRYGAAFGAKQSGTTLTRSSSSDTLTGDVVRYQQRVGGVPVMAGELVMSLRADRELDSILAKTSRVTKVNGAKVTQSAAADAAQTAFQRVAGRGAAATISAAGRWVVDPVLIGASADIPVRTAWRFELTRGADERRLLLVDDQTGFVLINSDLIGHIKRRIVCDNNQVLQNPNVVQAACTNASANKVRGEGDPPAALAEANTAYDLGGATHDGFAAFGIADLTELIGRDIGGGVKALSQTVRWCYSGSTCPYGNAFWNGSGMYYGTGYAVADDVVGHEMGHGVTEKTSNLVYWGQSGAMNESLSDIFGEIIDHRTVDGGDTPTSFTVGEDLPIGAIRDMATPGNFGDPDRTGSPNYVKETCGVSCYPDNDGVHQNSGVSNKAFWLASQGGTFNGQTVTGIDVGDANLTKSGRLWLLVDQGLTSGSGWSELNVVLNQACATLQGAAVVTAANCEAVAKAALATELATTPVLNPQPADATISCPGTGVPRVLFDSETGTPATKFTAGALWSRNGAPQTGQVAYSGPDAWSNAEAATAGQSPLTAAAPIALPAGQPAYLHFQQWRVLDYDTGGFYDGGTVEINGAPTATGTWVNGPSETMFSGFANPIPGQKAFGGDSRGYLASRLDLTSFAGTSVTPRFTMNTDNSIAFLGWYLDDIRVYTCDPAPVPPVLAVTAGSVDIKGKLLVGKKLKAKTSGWLPADVTYTYQWLRNGKVIKKATDRKYKLTNKDKGKKMQVVVTATKTGYTPATVTSKKTKKVKE